MSKGHSLDDVIDEELVNRGLNPDTDRDILFSDGFTAYQYPEGIFLALAIRTCVTTRCPINDSEDIIKVEVEYRVNKFGKFIEHHSFLNWLDTFRERGMGLEVTCNTIYEKIDEVVQPNQLKVTCQSHSNYLSINEAVREKDF